jgi:hypothetical protein
VGLDSFSDAGITPDIKVAELQFGLCQPRPRKVNESRVSAGRRERACDPRAVLDRKSKDSKPRGNEWVVPSYSACDSDWMARALSWVKRSGQAA